MAGGTCRAPDGGSRYDPMDNLTHSMVGWALSQAGLKSKTRKGTAALILGANLPDIDIFFGWLPWAALATHRGFSHGLLGGVILLPAMLAGLLWLLDRWQSGRGGGLPSGRIDARWLIALSYLGAVTHSLLDLQTVYAVQLLQPLSNRWFHTDTLFIIDAFILVILVAAIWQSRRRERTGERWQKPAMWGLLVVLGYIGLNGAISLAARDRLEAHLGFRPGVLYARSVPVSFWKRELVWRDRGLIGMAIYNPLRSISKLEEMQPLLSDQMLNPLTQRAIRVTPGLAPFLRWSTMPIAVISRRECEASVEFGDARFVTIGALGGPLPAIRPFVEPPVIVPLSAPGCPIS